MARPPHDKPMSRKEERKLLEMFRATFEERHPNPDRIGCPDFRKLEDLASRKRLADAEAVVTHLTQCSPCFRQYSQLVRSRKMRRLVLPLAAVAILVLGATFWLWKVRIVSTPEYPPIVKTPEPRPTPGPSEVR